MSHPSHDASKVTLAVSALLVRLLETSPCASCITSGVVSALASWGNVLIDCKRFDPAFADATAKALELIARHVRLGLRIEQSDVAAEAIPPRKH